LTIEASTTFILNTIEADGQRGGWQASGSFANDQDEVEFGRRIDLYLTAEGGGLWEAAAILAMRGSVLPQSVRWDIRQSSTDVTVATTDVFLQNAALQGIYFSDPAVLSNPHQNTNLRLGHIVQHIIEQHTNISSTAFIQNTNGTYSATLVGGWVDTTGIDTTVSTKVDVYTVRASNSIWQTLQGIARNEYYVCYMNKQDDFIYKPRPVFETVLNTITLAIDDDMIIAQPEAIYRDRVQMDQVVLSALTDTGLILRSEYPANIASNGRKLSVTNLRCNAQARLDQLAQRVFSFESRPYDLRIQLAGAWGLYLELFDRVSITYTGTARNGVSLTFVAEPFYIDKIRVSRSDTFGAVTELGLQQENIIGVLYAT